MLLLLILLLFFHLQETNKMSPEDALEAINDPALTKLPPSNRIVQKFLDNRPEDEQNNNVDGIQGVALMDAIFLHLKPSQQAKCGIGMDGKCPANCQNWVSNTTHPRCQSVCQPEKTATDFVAREQGDANGSSKEAQQEKNQKPHVQTERLAMKGSTPSVPTRCMEPKQRSTSRRSVKRLRRARRLSETMLSREAWGNSACEWQ